MCSLCPFVYGFRVPWDEVAQAWAPYSRIQSFLPCVSEVHFWFVSLDYSILGHLLSSPRMPKSALSAFDTGMLGVDGREETEETWIMEVSWEFRTWAKTHGNIGVGSGWEAYSSLDSAS